ERRMHRFEREHNLPGFNTVEANYRTWNDGWDWSQKGEEWTQSAPWKQSLIDDVMFKYMIHDGVLLEIGPGAGRWTEALHRIARQLIVVDLSDRCIAMCKERFAGYSGIDFFVNNGRDLSMLDASSIDSVWSFDVFVHIAPRETDGYIAEISRVLRPHGVGVIHYPGEGNTSEQAKLHWRSPVTAQWFADT